MIQPVLRLSLLGPPLITVNNLPIEVDRKKAIALLSYLAVTGQIQTRDGLAALFWPESSRARSNLRQTLWILKQALGEGWLEMEREQVWLRPNYYLDVGHLGEVVTEAEAVLADNSRPIDLVRLGEAADLYRDTFLASFTLPDAPEFDAWQLWQAQRLEQKLGVALQLLVHAYKQQALWEPAVRYGQRWVALDPLHEDAHYELMQLYAAAGQKTAAMHQYEQCHQLLADELGIAPQGMLVELHETLRQNGHILPANNQLVFHPKLLPGLPLHEVPNPGPLPPGSRMLLRPNPHFVGRQDELKQLARLLRTDNNVAVSPSLVATTGLGGIGKTQLAVEFAYRYGRFFPGGVFWLNCAEAAAVPDEIAQCGGADGMALADDFEQWPLKKQIRRVQEAWQEPTSRLLIFDNCEDMSLFNQWRPAVGGCCVLITSRRSRWDPALAVTALTLGTLERDESIDLLSRFLPDLVGDYDTADAIAAELGDLPLALHLAGCFLARYNQAISPAVYLEQLQDQSLLLHPSLLGKGTEFLPTAHDKQVARTFQLSYERLNPNRAVDRLALDILARSSYLAAGELIPRSLLLSTLNMELDDLTTILLVEDGLLRLVELGLLEEKATGSLRLHRLLAMMVHRLLADEAVQLDVEEGVRRALKQNIDESAYVGSIPQLMPHLRVVIAAAVSRPSETVASLNKWYGKHLQDAGNYSAVRPYYERCLAIRRQILGDKHPHTASILISLGNIYKFLDDLEEAQNYQEQALVIYQEALGADHPSVAKCLTNIGAIIHNQGRFPEALDTFKQAKAIFEHTLGLEHPQTANCINNLAVLLVDMGDYEQAQFYYEQTLAIDKSTVGEAHPYTAMSYSNLGELSAKKRDWPGAIAYYEKSLSIFRQSVGNEHPYTAEALNGLGCVFHQMGDLAGAKVALEQALNVRRQTLGADALDTASSLRDLGKLLHDMGDIETAILYLKQAFNIYSTNLGDDNYQTKELADYLSDKLVAV